MLTRAQFVTHLTNRNYFLYLGGPSRVRTRSSMIPVVNAVAAFGAAGTGANLLQLIQAIGNLPPASKVKYADALNNLYSSFPNAFYVTFAPFTLHTALAPGIGVVRSANVPSHQTDAVLALQQLNGFPEGQGLLQALCAQVAAGHRVGISDAVGTASGGNECAIVAGMPDDYLTTLAAALAGNYPAVGNCIRQAMAALGHDPAVGGGGAAYTWLEGEINNTPAYQLLGIPAVAASSLTHGANWISAAALRSWVEGTAVFPAGVNPAHEDAARVVLGVVLYPGSTAGIGGHTRVRWNASNVTSAGTVRPPFIGMGHELIHALHNMRGDQPGVENGATTVLYEYLCVGLGPYNGWANTENSLRQGAGVALRPYYGP